MFLYRGGQSVEEGTYWEPNTGKKVILEGKGFLPAGKQWYYKLPESWLLIPLFLYGLALSMAFPYGVGVLIFGVICLVTKVLYSLGGAFGRLFGNAVAYIFVRYKPNVSFFTGKPKKKQRQGKK